MWMCSELNLKNGKNVKLNDVKKLLKMVIKIVKMLLKKMKRVISI